MNKPKQFWIKACCEEIEEQMHGPADASFSVEEPVYSEGYSTMLVREVTEFDEIESLRKQVAMLEEALNGLKPECEAVINDQHPDCGVCKPYQAALDALTRLNTMRSEKRN